jgi:hypothetical protein
MTIQTIIPNHGSPVQAVIQAGRGPRILLVPSMAAPQEKNEALIEFMRAATEKTGQGFASFLPATPGRFDEVGHSGATKALLNTSALDFGLTGAWIVAGARSERVVVERAFHHAKNMQNVCVTPVYFEQSLYDTLPDRVKFVRTLAQTAAAL